MRKPSSMIIFIYALIVSLLAFMIKRIDHLIIIGSMNLVSGASLGFRRFRGLIILYIAGVIGLFINSLLVSNRGEVVFSLGWLVVREGVLRSVADIFFRLGMIFGATLLFLSLTEPREFIKDLERYLRLPKGVVFSIFYALRLYPLLAKDLDEIMLVRSERMRRRMIITPGDVNSLVVPLLNISLERAVWAGIAAEMRGLSIRRPVYRGKRFSTTDLLIITFLMIQILITIFI